MKTKVFLGRSGVQLIPLGWFMKNVDFLKMLTEMSANFLVLQ